MLGDVAVCVELFWEPGSRVEDRPVDDRDEEGICRDRGVVE